MTVASIGVQAATTLTYTYCSDCYKPQAAEVLTLVNLFRQIFAFSIGFDALPFGEKDGFDVAWGTCAALQFAAWLPLLILIWKGKLFGSGKACQIYIRIWSNTEFSDKFFVFAL